MITYMWPTVVRYCYPIVHDITLQLLAVWEENGPLVLWACVVLEHGAQTHVYVSCVKYL
jgi:hypothetical protein